MAIWIDHNHSLYANSFGWEVAFCRLAKINRVGGKVFRPFAASTRANRDETESVRRRVDEQSAWRNCSVNCKWVRVHSGLPASLFRSPHRIFRVWFSGKLECSMGHAVRPRRRISESAGPVLCWFGVRIARAVFIIPAVPWYFVRNVIRIKF